MIESAATGLVCIRCGTRYGLDPLFEGCPACAKPGDLANLRVTYDYTRASRSFTRRALSARRTAGVWRWAELLPIAAEQSRKTLGEGATPLVPAPQLNLGDVRVKDESRNPTWSYKDRLCAVAVSRAVEQGARVCVVSSTGNHASAAAAYAARADLPCVVFTRVGVPMVMMTLPRVYGARVFAGPSRGQERWALLKAGVERAGWYPLSNYTAPVTGNPYGVEGYKTIAFEILEQLDGQVPGSVVVPTAYGEGVFGIWRGFEDLRALGWTERVPQMVAAETATAGPLAHALASGADRVLPVPTSLSVAFSINSGTSGLHALQAIRASRGLSVKVSDEEIVRAQHDLARMGLFVEATSAASVAAVSRLRAEGSPLEEPVIVVSTSSGLKDMSPALAHLPVVQEVSGDWEELVPLLGPELLVQARHGAEVRN